MSGKAALNIASSQAQAEKNLGCETARASLESVPQLCTRKDEHGTKQLKDLHCMYGIMPCNKAETSVDINASAQ
jgi:hypothetical protein